MVEQNQLLLPMKNKGKNGTDLWRKNGYFSTQACDFSIEKANFPENTIFYINQAYLSYKDNKKIYYNDIFIIGQITPLVNQPENISAYSPKEDEVKILRPKCNSTTGNFLGLQYCIAYLTVQNDLQKQFFGYGYSKENNKILCSTHKIKIPSSFSTTIFSSMSREHLAKLAFQTPFFSYHQLLIELRR